MNEVQEEYLAAMKKAMIDYVIANPIDRARLSLESLQPLRRQPSPLQAAHRSVYERELPRWWHADVMHSHASVAASLQTLSSNALTLSAQWMDGLFHTTLLVDVETAEFARSLPVHVDQFQQRQTECAEQVRLPRLLPLALGHDRLRIAVQLRRVPACCMRRLAARSSCPSLQHSRLSGPPPANRRSRRCCGPPGCPSAWKRSARCRRRRWAATPTRTTGPS